MTIKDKTREKTTNQKFNCSLCEILFEHVCSGIALYEAIDNGNDFIFKDFNKAAESIEKLNKNELIGKQVTEIFPGIRQFGLLEVFQRVYKTGIPEHFPIRLYKDERIVGWRKNYVCKLSTGEIVAIYEDITEEKKYEDKLAKSAAQLKETLFETIKAFGIAIEKRHPYTAVHQKRVANLARAIAEKMQLSTHQIEGVYLGALIHDIGKLYIPLSILNGRNKLSPEEKKLIQQHPSNAYDILKQIKFPWPLAEIVSSHHERMDGSGYPRGLKGDQILIEARIIAVADFVESMLSKRPYSQAEPINKIVKELEKAKGSLFDSKVVDTCIILLKKYDFSLD